MNTFSNRLQTGQRVRAFPNTIPSSSRAPLIMSLLRPEVLFAFGAFQALFPYFIWTTVGPNENYNQDISGLPALLWVLGLISFFLGANLFKGRAKPTNRHVLVNRHRVRFVLFLALFFWMALLIPVIRAYGGIPLLGFFSGSISVANVNESQASSIPGLFGLWLVANTVLMIATTLAIFIKLRSRQLLTPLVKFSIAVVVFGAVMAGKRQSLLIAVTIMVPSLIIAINYYLGPELLRKISKKLIASVATIIFSFIFVFGFIGQLRTIGVVQESPILQIYNYLEFPLINMEWQLSVFGLSDGADNIIPLLSGFIPYKMISGRAFDLDNTIEVYSFFYPEPGIGAGFFGPVHLAFGIYGVIIFGAIAGFFSKMIYSQALKDPSWIIPYTIFIWPLVAAHSYSHLTSALFFVLPFALSVIVSQFVFKRVYSQ